MVYDILGRVILPLSRQIAKGICAAILMTQIASDLQILPKKGPLYA